MFKSVPNKPQKVMTQPIVHIQCANKHDADRLVIATLVSVMDAGYDGEYTSGLKIVAEGYKDNISMHESQVYEVVQRGSAKKNK